MNASEKMQGKALNPMLRMAALAGVESAVRLHIRRGDDLNARDGGGLTPIMLAASKNHASVCSLLLEAGADPALCDSAGRDALTIALSVGAGCAAEVLSAFVLRSEVPEVEHSPLVADTPEWMGAISLDEDWELGEFGSWEADDEKPPPEGDSSIAKAAAAIHHSISSHFPVDTAEDWTDFIALLPEAATKPKSEENSSDDLRSLLLRAVREGAVPEASVLRVCHLGETDDEARERIVRALLAEVGVEPDERVEEGDEPFMVEPSDEEDAAVSDLVSYVEDLDPWHCDPARCYAREMRIGRLLSAEEEVLLGKEMEQGIYLASKALAGWPAGLNELERAGKVVASGLADATAYVLSALDEADETGDVATGDEEDEDEVSPLSGLDDAFLSGLADISSLRKVNPGHITALETAIAKLRLAPAFLLGLSGIAKDDAEAGAFRSAIERYSNARETMTICNLRMVYNVVKRYQGLGLPFDDLLQEGNMGLMKAVERYDWRRGFKFSTYATWWIRQSASRAVADTGRTIRLPVHVNEKLSILRRAIEDYEIRKGNTPSDRVLADLVSMPLGRVSMLRARMEEPRCLHEMDANGIPFEENLSDEPEDRPDAIAERVALIEIMGRVVSDLDEHTAEIITMRYGLDGAGSRTLAETGKHFGVTRERIRQIESKALRKLAQILRSKVFPHFLYALPPEVEPSSDKSEGPRNSKLSGRSINNTGDDKAKSEAGEGIARILMQELEALSDALNASLDDETVSSMQAAAEARTNALISFACEIGAKVDDKRGAGGVVSVRLPTQRDAKSMRLARELLGAGFKPYPGQVFAK